MIRIIDLISWIIDLPVPYRYNAQIMPSGLTAVQQKHVLGAEICMWYAGRHPLMLKPVVYAWCRRVVQGRES